MVARSRLVTVGGRSHRDGPLALLRAIRALFGHLSPEEAPEVSLAADAVLVGGSAPTIEESLRIKAYLIVQRNQVRDYLDVVALADRLGFDDAVEVLEHIDDYYVDRSGERASVVTALVLRLAKPAPLDTDVIDELPRYKGIVEQWQDWEDVVDACKRLALALAEGTS